jgi:hypothetical protein
MINIMAQSQPTRTISEIATRMISLAVYCALESRTLPAAATVGMKEISIKNKVISQKNHPVLYNLVRKEYLSSY